MTNKKTKKPMKPLQELTLLDRFLFSRTIEDPDTYEAMLSILLGEDIHLLPSVQAEKELGVSPLLRSIRVDVYSMDDKGTIYSSESQEKNTYNIPKRSRYYGALVDSSLLPPGTKNFNRLNDTIIIFIAPFDLFGYDKYCYTFQMKCKEVEGLELEDGATRIFFNTHGKNKDEVSPELIELLEYIEHTTERSNEDSKVEGIRTIQEQVKRIKASEEMGVRYMMEWEEKLEFKEEGEDRVNLLNQKLIELERMEDLVRSTADKEFQQKLFEEFGL